MWNHISNLVRVEEAVALVQPVAGGNVNNANRMQEDVFDMIDAMRPARPGQGIGEVASYCSLPIESVKCNVLDWWKVHELHYPNLAKLARIYLGMPASSATEERVFSRASLVLTDRRTRLGNDVFEAQVVSHHNRRFLAHLKIKYRD